MLLFDAAMIGSSDDTSVLVPTARRDEGRNLSVSAVHLRQDGDRWVWMLIAEDGKSVATGEAHSREDALQTAQDADGHSH